MNLVICDPKTGKAYSKKIEEAGFLANKKIGQEVDLSGIGLQGYSGKIAGGSDKTGTAMKRDIEGISRKAVLVAGGIGFKPKRRGMRKRINLRGNTVSGETSQINLIVTKYGEKSLEEMFKKEAPAEKAGEKQAEEKKEKTVEEKKEPSSKEEKKEKPAEEKKEAEKEPAEKKEGEKKEKK